MGTKVFIDGEAGTTGLQIRERLENRSALDVISIDPAKRKDNSERQRLIEQADVVILCLPDIAAKESVALGKNSNARFIDASTAHRTDENWVYGFAEMDKQQPELINQAKYVSNPGCWPQGLIATLRPLVNAGLLPASTAICAHGITGYSGGGNAMIAAYESADDDGNQFKPYSLALRHKHLPEMQRYAKLEKPPVFAPSIGHFSQGMMVMIPLPLWSLEQVPTVRNLHAAIADHYASIEHSAVEVAPLDESESASAEVLNAQQFNNTNTMRLHVFGNDDSQQAVLCAVYDNLGKGASGAAVQNLEIMFGLQ